jgi:hypothetical protein
MFRSNETGVEPIAQNHQQQAFAALCFVLDGQTKELVAWGGIEPPTRGFSIRCSTN